MKVLIIATLLNMPQNKGSIKEIKSRLLELYSSSLPSEGKPLSEWETTLVKTLSRHKSLFLKLGAVYKLDSSQLTEVQDEELTYREVQRKTGA